MHPIEELAWLQDAISRHGTKWMQLETAMAHLLHQVIHLEEETRIAHAIYYALEGFHPRQALVNAAVTEWVYENKADELGGLWDRLHDKFGGARKMRNNIAHGTTRWVDPEGKRYPRLIPPLIDTKVVKATRDGKVPGETAHNVDTAVKRLDKIVDCVRMVNAAIGCFRKNDSQALREICTQLESNLTQLNKMG